jgi:hypothetical protein
MKAQVFLIVLALLATAQLATSLRAATPEQEKVFLQKYKAAFEAGDRAALASFLYTQGASPMAIQIFKAMQANAIGGTITSIDLVDLTPKEVQKAERVEVGPGGQKFILPLKPAKKLRISIATKTADGISASRSESLVAEKDGKLVIPVPVNAK